MLTIASLLAAMTIAGAFWVGVLAARRLRDWGEGRRALEEGHRPLALVGAVSGSVEDARSRRVRARVAEKLVNGGASDGAMPRALETTDLDLSSLRERDVVSVDAADATADGDYVVEGLVSLREGALRSTVAVLSDAGREVWLIGNPEQERWLLVRPVPGHGLHGEPPRQIRHGGGAYGLERRAQASAAVTGRHGRPNGTRVATYLYRASPREALWVERWGDEVLMAAGTPVAAHNVTFLPGS